MVNSDAATLQNISAPLNIVPFCKNMRVDPTNKAGRA